MAAPLTVDVGPDWFDPQQLPNLCGAYTYVARDRDGRPLYVGKCDNPRSRFTVHRCRSDWFPLVGSVELEPHPNHKSALQREADLIRSLRPPRNVQHHPELRAMRLALRHDHGLTGLHLRSATDVAILMRAGVDVHAVAAALEAVA